MKKERLSFINDLLFETPGGTRYTQDSPILPPVWLAFAAEPHRQQELILTATNDIGAGQVAKELRRMLAELRRDSPKVLDENNQQVERKRARVAYIPGQIAVKLYFDEMMRVVLPLTPWWHETYDELRAFQRTAGENARVADWRAFPTPDPNREKDLVDALMLMRREIDPTAFAEPRRVEESEERLRYIRRIPPSLSWLVRIAGLIADGFQNGTELLGGEDSIGSRLKRDFDARLHDRIESFHARQKRTQKLRLEFPKARQTRKELVSAFTNLYEGWAADENFPKDRVVWRVTKNRRIHLAVKKSALTVKADAARHLFNISCKNITWAVLDSGIDSNHPRLSLLAWSTNKRHAVY